MTTATVVALVAIAAAVVAVVAIVIAKRLQGSVTLSIVGTRFRPGDLVQGSVRARARRDLDHQSVTVAVRCLDLSDNATTSARTVVERQVAIAGPGRLRAGDTLELPFAVEVPSRDAARMVELTGDEPSDQPDDALAALVRRAAEGAADRHSRRLQWEVVASLAAGALTLEDRARIDVDV